MPKPPHWPINALFYSIIDHFGYQVEEFDEEHLEGPQVVRVEALDEVVGQDPLLLGSLLLVQDEGVEAGDDVLDFAALPHLEDGVRCVEHQGLEVCWCSRRTNLLLFQILLGYYPKPWAYICVHMFGLRLPQMAWLGVFP